VALGIGGLGASHAAAFGSFGTLSVAEQTARPPALPALVAAPPGNLSAAAHAPFTAILTIDGTGPSQGAIRFTLTGGSASAAAGNVVPRILAPASVHAVAKIVFTVKSLAVASVYPAPLFSFHA
jgi:hypothetical protein